MPTKPIATFFFSTDANFSSGPAVGNPTKIAPPSFAQGFIPGDGIAAEHVNYLENITGTWLTDWVSQGTFDPDEDAHLVETDANGKASFAIAEVGGSSAASEPSLTVTEPSGTGASLLVSYGAGTHRPLSVQNNAANAISAIFFESTAGTGNVLGLNSTSTHTGRGLTITTMDGGAAPIRLAGRNLPSGPALGDLYVDDETDHERLRVWAQGAWGSVWTTPNGFFRAYGENLTAASTSAAGSFISRVSLVIPASAGLRLGSKVHLRATCEMGSNIVTASFQFGFVDSTAAVEISSRSVRTFAATNAADERYAVTEIDYTIPSDGARTIYFGYRSNGANTVHIRNVTFEITGQY